jgi:hypothetical protein
MTWGQKLIRLANQALEELAAEEFNVAAILEKARAFAAQGYKSCIIVPSRPVDIRHTSAFKTTREELERHRLRLIWESRIQPPHNEPYAVLLVSWADSERETQ